MRKENLIFILSGQFSDRSFEGGEGKWLRLCLMVYSLGQREVRRQLFNAQTGIPNQLGKLTPRPTLRWIFQCFQGLHLLVHQGIKQVVNLTEES